MNQGRNEPCHCGSGKKFKNCCGAIGQAPLPQARPQPVSPAEMFGQIAECLNTGRFRDAEILCQRVLAVTPANPDACYLSGLTARCLGNPPEAVRHLRRAVELRPREASFHCGLGIALNEAGQTEAAIASLERAIELNPRYAEAWNNLGYIHLQAQSYTSAETHFRKALACEPRMAEAHYNLGCALEPLNQPAAAEAAYRRALEANPRYFDALNNLGLLLRAQGRLAEAVACCKQAVALNPGHARCQYNLGALLLECGAAREAIGYCARAVELQPDFVDAYVILAWTQAVAGHIEEALQSARRALELAPERIDSHLNLACIHEKKSDYASAQACYRNLQTLAPGALEFRIREMAASLPRQTGSIEEIAAIRERLNRQIESLIDTEDGVKTPEQSAFTLFCLAYHGINDRPLLERAAALVQAKVPGLQTNDLPARPADRKRIHIGFISSCLHNHSIGKLNIGYIRHLDRSRFHVTVIHAPGYFSDAFSAEIDRLADASVPLSHNLETARQQILALALDILHYPDIGMLPLQSLLAHSRLAPVQTTSWGHPNTTGIPAIDYFISMDAAEPEWAEAHYSERLVRLQRAPACFDPVPAVAPRTRAASGLPERGRLYGCLQTLIKFHPDFDPVLDEILARDPEAWIIAIKDSGGALMQQLQTRWARQYPRLVQRVVFLPRQSSEDFLALLASMDLLLDTPHFGSGVSFYESAAQAVPSVTWPGEFLRGRLVAGFYRWLGVEDAPIVTRLADYAATAVAYATDTVRLDRLKAQIRAKASRLYDDRDAVRELEDFFAHAHACHLAGQAGTPFRSRFAWPGHS